MSAASATPSSLPELWTELPTQVRAFLITIAFAFVAYKTYGRKWCTRSFGDIDLFCWTLYITAAIQALQFHCRIPWVPIAHNPHTISLAMIALGRWIAAQPQIKKEEDEPLRLALQVAALVTLSVLLIFCAITYIEYIGADAIAYIVKPLFAYRDEVECCTFGFCI
jgi:hypothetical protein